MVNSCRLSRFCAQPDLHAQMYYNQEPYIRTRIMIRITTRQDNIPDESADHIEQILLDRMDLSRHRFRTVSDRGTDIGIDLPPGTVLRHGDLVRGDGQIMVIRQKPELVGVVHPRVEVGHVTAGTMTLAGHAIGNMHRPISIVGDTIIFPVQARSEAETFQAIMDRIGAGQLEVSLEERVFVPHRAADVADHG